MKPPHLNESKIYFEFFLALKNVFSHIFRIDAHTIRLTCLYPKDSFLFFFFFQNNLNQSIYGRKQKMFSVSTAYHITFHFSYIYERNKTSKATLKHLWRQLDELMVKFETI